MCITEVINMCAWLDIIKDRLNKRQNDLKNQIQSGTLRLIEISEWQKEHELIMQQLSSRSRTIELLCASMRNKLKSKAAQLEGKVGQKSGQILSISPGQSQISSQEGIISQGLLMPAPKPELSNTGNSTISKDDRKARSAGSSTIDLKVLGMTEQLSELQTKWSNVWNLAHKIKKQIEIYHAHLSEVCKRNKIFDYNS